MPDKLPPRRLIFLSGPQARGKQAASELISSSGLQTKQALWLKPGDKALGLLGQEYVAVVLDAYLGLNPDVFARVSGLVQAGGALLVICPAFEDWPAYSDPETLKLSPYPEASAAVDGHYLKRWLRLINSLSGIECYAPENHDAVPVLISHKPDAPPSQACTPDQQQAIEAVLSVVQGQRRRPAIISANRGRGKSAALGLAAGELLTSGQAQNILLTASGFNQVGSVFKHAQAVLADASMLIGQKCLQHPCGTLRYIAADSLISEQHDCDLLIVDEASTLGVARLEALLRRYPRIAFSGTEQGYEGSGRGFSLKFRKLIQTHCRGQYAVKLNTPVRWAIHDPLEAWTNHLLLLNNEKVQGEAPQDIQLNELNFRKIEQSQLAEDEALLNTVMGLLINAHYQTRPVDCRFLLDAPNSRLFVAEHNNKIIGLVWLMLEGGLEPDIARAIVAGRRRPQGHLAPQILAAHLGLEDAITLRCARIQRIAVNPDLQDKGIGSWMLTRTEQHVDKNIDYLASSYGADLPLSRFWRRAGFHTVRMSDKPQAASGLHSALVLKPCSDAAKPLELQALTLFRTQFVHQLADGLRQMSPALAHCLVVHNPAKLDLSSDELKTAVLFAYAQRPYESSLAALAKNAQYALLKSQLEFESGHLTRDLFIKRTLQNQTWAQCSKALGMKGQGECVEQLRHGVRRVLSFALPEETIRRLRDRYGC